jgi:hypothetical protein
MENVTWKTARRKDSKGFPVNIKKFTQFNRRK